MKVRKAVFPAAGLGTRFLPTSKAVPKELLPILDKPMIQYGIEEVVAAGIEHVIIVTSQGKEALQSYFQGDPELERHLMASGPREFLDEVRRVPSLAHFSFVRQEEPRGLGHAVLMAEDLTGSGHSTRVVGSEPRFAIIIPLAD